VPVLDSRTKRIYQPDLQRGHSDGELGQLPGSTVELAWRPAAVDPIRPRNAPFQSAPTPTARIPPHLPFDLGKVTSEQCE